MAANGISISVVECKLAEPPKGETSPKDRRRVPRFPFVADGELVVVSSGTKISVRTSDLSLYGCYVRLANALPCGTQVLIKIFTETDFLEAPATVAYSQANLGNGLAFHDVNPHFLPTLQKWLAQALKERTKPGQET